MSCAMTQASKTGWLDPNTDTRHEKSSAKSFKNNSEILPQRKCTRLEWEKSRWATVLPPSSSAPWSGKQSSLDDRTTSLNEDFWSAPFAGVSLKDTPPSSPTSALMYHATTWNGRSTYSSCMRNERSRRCTTKLTASKSTTTRRSPRGTRSKLPPPAATRTLQVARQVLQRAR